MNSKLKQSAERYNDGLITAKEFLGDVINTIGARWSDLHLFESDETIDVDALAILLATLS